MYVLLTNFRFLAFLQNLFQSPNGSIPTINHFLRFLKLLASMQIMSPYLRFGRPIVQEFRMQSLKRFASAIASSIQRRNMEMKKTLAKGYAGVAFRATTFSFQQNFGRRIFVSIAHAKPSKKACSGLVWTMSISILSIGRPKVLPRHGWRWRKYTKKGLHVPSA